MFVFWDTLRAGELDYKIFSLKSMNFYSSTIVVFTMFCDCREIRKLVCKVENSTLQDLMGKEYFTMSCFSSKQGTSPKTFQYKNAIGPSFTFQDQG